LSGSLLALALLAACQSSIDFRPAPDRHNGDMIRSLRSVPAAPELGGRPGIEIQLFRAQGFPVRGEIPILRVGSREFQLSRYPPSGDTRSLIFTLSTEEFAQLMTGDEVSVQYGRDASAPRWNFGRLDKARLDRSPAGR